MRDTPPPSRSSPRRAPELGAYRAVLDTSAGPITIEFFVDKAPNTVRQFMRLAAAGVYNGHGVSPRRAGLRHPDRRAVEPRRRRSPRSSRRWSTTCAPEFNDTKHVKGIVSMARGDAPDSATTSFFICTGDVDGARRRVHRVRPRRRRDGGRGGDRGGAAERRGADHADRAEDRPHREEVIGPVKTAARPAHRVGGARRWRACWHRVPPLDPSRPVRFDAAVGFGDYSLRLHLSRPCAIDAAHPLLLYATGDGGWRGKDKDAFEHMARWGYPLAGLQRARVPQASGPAGARGPSAGRGARLRADDRASRSRSSACPRPRRRCSSASRAGPGSRWRRPAIRPCSDRSSASWRSRSPVRRNTCTVCGGGAAGRAPTPSW